MCELTLGCAVPGSLLGHAGRSGTRWRAGPGKTAGASSPALRWS